MRKEQGWRHLLDAHGLRPSDDTTSLICMILSLTLLNGPRNTSRKPLSVNTIRRAICRCQLKLYHAKRKPYVNMVQKPRHVLWAKAHLKWTVSKWKIILWPDDSKFDIHGHFSISASAPRHPRSPDGWMDGSPWQEIGHRYRLQKS